MTESGGAPVVKARVFNDAGAAGTMGVTEDALPPRDALGAGDSGVLLAPPDFGRFRFSIGVRTLGSGAVLKLTLRSADGAIAKTVTKTYPSSYQVQQAASDLLEGASFSGNESVTVEIVSGSAFVYATIGDNTTNDPAIQMARRMR